MECNEWVEKGLLFSSGELDGAESASFDDHLQSCAACREWLSSYRFEQENFYSQSMLLVDTPPDLDTAIKTACSKTPRFTSNPFLFTSILRKTTVSALFLMLGVGVSLYFVYNLETASQSTIARRTSETGTQTKPVHHQGNPPASEQIIMVTGIDSASDSLDGMRRQNRGTLTQGVIPVDVRGK